MSKDIEQFEIIANQEVGRINFDFKFVKTQLVELLQPYENLVYSEENIKDAKKDRANLNKLKKEVQSKQKLYKEVCLKPFKDIEPQIKELIFMIENQSEVIDVCVKEYENKAKEEKLVKIKKYALLYNLNVK